MQRHFSSGVDCATAGFGKLGLYKLTKFYYYPGWWEGGMSLHLMFNTDRWNELTPTYKSIVQQAAARAALVTQARYDALNPKALKSLADKGVQLRPFPQDTVEAAYKAAQELYAEIGEANPRFKRIHEHWDRFRVEQVQWFRVAEDSLANFQAVATAPR